MQMCGLHETSYELILPDSPGTETAKEVLYVPESPASPVPDIWGIFGQDRRLVTGSGYFRGPGPHLPHQNYTTDIDFRRVAARAPDQKYIYGGRIVPHFGHFLLGCLPRFWRHHELAARKRKIVLHSPHDVGTLFSYPHIAAIFGALGLTPDDFVIFANPTRIAELIIPYPSFEEGHLAYPAFAVFCHDVGRTLIGRSPLQPNDTPVYFTKQNLPSGISRVLNEDAFTDILARRGVEIISPETMSVAEQVKLFAQRRFIAGSVGSVFHTSIFCPRRKLLILNWGDTIYRNFSLIDRINENDSHYVFPKDEIEFVGSVSGFGANWKLTSPTRAADQFLMAMDAFFVPAKPRDGRPINMALRKPTRQSSYAGEDPEADCRAGRSAVSGRLTGGVNFHTAYEDEPWWQVDLEAEIDITRIVLFNVIGPAMVTERAAKFRLLVSSDQIEWLEVFRRVDPQAFGGFDSAPFAWDAPTPLVGRYVRVQLLGAAFFHLDQVQVFGRVVTQGRAEPVVGAVHGSWLASRVRRLLPSFRKKTPSQTI